MIAGIDLGTTYTKDHLGNIYPSGISENTLMSTNVFAVDNKQYAMELHHQRAEYDTNINKGLNKNTRINFLYALYKLAESENTIFETVLTALPCSQWKNDITVEQFKKYLLYNMPLELDLNGNKKTILIENLEIVPESSTAYYATNMDYYRFNGRKVLIVDIGGLTINSCLYDGDQYVDCHTDESGILKVYKDTAEAIMTETGENIRYTDMFNILKSGLYIRGQKVDIEPIILPVIMTHCNSIYKDLKLKWSIDTIPYVIMIGAGSITLHKYILHFIPHAELSSDPQIIAAIGMGEMVGANI
jgi:hypothetical protein